MLFFFFKFFLGLNEWINELDSRYTRKLQKSSSCTPPKERNLGTPATSNPPLPIVQWAVNPEWNISSG